VTAPLMGGNDREIDSLGHESRTTAKMLHAIFAGSVVAAALMLLLSITNCVQNARPWTAGFMPYRSPAWRSWPLQFGAQPYQRCLMVNNGGWARRSGPAAFFCRSSNRCSRRPCRWQPAQPPKSEPTSALPVVPDSREPDDSETLRRCDQRDTLTFRRVSGTWIFGPCTDTTQPGSFPWSSATCVPSPRRTSIVRSSWCRIDALMPSTNRYASSGRAESGAERRRMTVVIRRYSTLARLTRSGRPPPG
jgi:hypothetical protein